MFTWVFRFLQCFALLPHPSMYTVGFSLYEEDFIYATVDIMRRYSRHTLDGPIISITNGDSLNISNDMFYYTEPGARVSIYCKSSSIRNYDLRRNRGKFFSVISHVQYTYHVLYHVLYHVVPRVGSEFDK